MKTLTLTNFEIDSIVRNLESPESILFSDDPKKMLPISIMWKIDENFERIKNIHNRLQKRREQIEQKYADDEHSVIETIKGQQVRKVKDKYAMDFGKELGELMSITNEVEIDPIMIDVFNDKAFTPKDYRTIRFMLDKEKENTEVTEETKAASANEK